MTDHLTKQPKPPAGIGTCATCKYWDRDNKERVIQTPQGMHRVADLVANGMPVPKDKIIVVSHCTFFPMWGMMTDNHWCWQQQDRLQVVQQDNDIFPSA